MPLDSGHAVDRRGIFAFPSLINEIISSYSTKFIGGPKGLSAAKILNRSLQTILLLRYISTLITGEKMQPAGFLVRVEKHLILEGTDTC
jgi:hypothetical protein